MTASNVRTAAGCAASVLLVLGTIPTGAPGELLASTGTGLVAAGVGVAGVLVTALPDPGRRGFHRYPVWVSLGIAVAVVALVGAGLLPERIVWPVIAWGVSVVCVDALWLACDRRLEHA